MNCVEGGSRKSVKVIFSSVCSGEKMLNICKMLKSVLFKGFVLSEDLVPCT